MGSFSTAWPQVPIISPVSERYKGRAHHYGCPLSLPRLENVPLHQVNSAKKHLKIELLSPPMLPAEWGYIIVIAVIGISNPRTTLSRIGDGMLEIPIVWIALLKRLSSKPRVIS